MQFTTPIPIPKGNNPISYDSQIISLGSCFAVNIAEKLNYFKFQNTCNPFGILFHPLAIHEIIRKSLSDEKFIDSDIFYHNEMWHCFSAHSELSNLRKEALLQNLNESLEIVRNKITKATHVIITYGTAWVYRDTKTGNLVANCHKLPQSQFTKELLPVETIQSGIAETITLIKKASPMCAIIFTVSPVRHIKDGFIENQRSKAHLITAIHNVLDKHQIQADYFPSYEIMMDELRDYRFYSEDMLHPNATAIQYIWNRFAETRLSAATQTVMAEVSHIRKALQHKPFHPDSESHKRFLKKLQSKIQQLRQRFPDITF